MPDQISLTKPKLKYLFKALFDDGSIFEQDPDDTSKTKPGGSAFTDYLAIDKPTISFGIFGEENTLVVDMRDGHFELNGVPLLFDQVDMPQRPTPLKLIFYRQRQKDLSISYEVDKDLKPVITDQKEVASRCIYFLGWECNVAGKNYKKVLGLA